MWSWSKGIPLWSVWATCPGCPLTGFCPPLSCWWGWNAGEGPDAEPALLSSAQSTGVFPVPFQLPLQSSAVRAALGKWAPARPNATLLIFQLQKNIHRGDSCRSISFQKNLSRFLKLSNQGHVYSLSTRTMLIPVLWLSRDWLYPHWSKWKIYVVIAPKWLFLHIPDIESQFNRTWNHTTISS